MVFALSHQQTQSFKIKRHSANHNRAVNKTSAGVAGIHWRPWRKQCHNRNYVWKSEITSTKLKNLKTELRERNLETQTILPGEKSLKGAKDVGVIKEKSLVLVIHASVPILNTDKFEPTLPQRHAEWSEWMRRIFWRWDSSLPPAHPPLALSKTR